MDRTHVPLSAIFWLMGLTLAWGGSWPVMKFALSELPIYTFRTLTGALAAICVLLLSAALGHSLKLPREDWRPAAIAGLFNITGWFYFTAVGLTLLPAGRSAVLAYTMPVWAVIAARILANDPITARKVLGLLLGMGAVATLVGADIVKFGETPIGALAVLGAAISWAIGTVIQKRDWNTPILTLIGWQLVFGTIPLVILAFLYDTAPFADLTWRGALAVSHVVLIACLFGYWAWFNVVKLVPTSVASIAVLTVPLVGVTSSALMLGESVGIAELVALVLITGALATILLKPNGQYS